MVRGLTIMKVISIAKTFIFMLIHEEQQRRSMYLMLLLNFNLPRNANGKRAVNSVCCPYVRLFVRLFVTRLDCKTAPHRITAEPIELIFGEDATFGGSTHTIH